MSVEIRIKNTMEQWINNLGSMEAYKWFHLAATWNKYSNLTVYINGTELSSVDGVSYTPLTGHVISNMLIGKPNNADDSHHFGEVTIDEWYFWDSILTSDHIKNVYGVYLYSGNLFLSHI